MRAPACADLPQLVLGPLVGRPDADWHRAPPGKWSPLQIVQHLAIGIDGSARTFAALERELLPARARDLFVKHPRLGDLTLPEWVRFHAAHCAHHAKQIRARR